MTIIRVNSIQVWNKMRNFAPVLMIIEASR